MAEASSDDALSPPDASEPVEREPKLDLVLDYLAFAARSHPLGMLLDEAPRRMAAAIDADVASVYLLEGDGDTLVLRGTVGQPKKARGKVRLAVGEGITGTAVAHQYPIATAHVGDHRHNRPFPELDEERFPALLAVPIVGTTGPLGAIVLQRTAGRAFSPAEIRLAAALTAPISTGIRLARLLNDLRGKARGSGGGTRRVTLPAVPVVPGKALGGVAALRRPASGAQTKVEAGDAESFLAALDTARRALDDLVERAHQLGVGADLMASTRLMLDDQRLRRRTVEQLEDGVPLAEALDEVARDAARAAARSDEPFLLRRASDLEELCQALTMLAMPDSRATLPSKAVVVARQLGIYDVIISARAQPVGIALTATEPDQRSMQLLELMGLPSVADVGGALRWATPGDIALVDADHGFFIVNPSRAEVAAFRRERRARRQEQPSAPGAASAHS